MPVRPNQRVAELAHQLSRFRSTSSSGEVLNFDGTTLYLIEYLVSHRSPPKSSRNVGFPPDWEISRSSLNRAVTELVKLSETLNLTELPDYLSWIAENSLPEADHAEPEKPLGRSRSRSVSSSSVVSSDKGKAPNRPLPSSEPEPTPSEPSTPRSGHSSEDPLNSPPTVRRTSLASITVPTKHITKAAKRLAFEPPHPESTVPRTDPIPTIENPIENPVDDPEPESTATESVLQPMQNTNPNPTRSQTQPQGFNFRFGNYSTMNPSNPGPSNAQRSREARPEPSLNDLYQLLLQNQERTDRRFTQFQEQLDRQQREEHERTGRAERTRSRRAASRRNPPDNDPDDSDDSDDSDHNRNGNNPPNNANTNANANANANNNNGFTGYWKTEEIGYFWPDMEDDVAIKQAGNAIYYKDVNVFVDRMRDIITYKGEDLVKANIQACLRGAALNWFTAQLTELEKMALRTAPLEAGWLTALSRRFKPNPQAALHKLTNTTYGYKDVRAGKTPQSFAEEIIRHCRAAEINTPFNQMSMIWNRLEPSLQRDVPMPEPTMNMALFLEKLEEKQYLWQNVTTHWNETKRNANRNTNGNRASGPKTNPVPYAGGFQNANHYGSLPSPYYQTPNPYYQPQYQPNAVPSTAYQNAPVYGHQAQHTFRGYGQNRWQSRGGWQNRSSNWNRPNNYSQRQIGYSQSNQNHNPNSSSRGNYNNRGSPHYNGRQPWNNHQNHNQNTGVRAYATENQANPNPEFDAMPDPDAQPVLNPEPSSWIDPYDHASGQMNEDSTQPDAYFAEPAMPEFAEPDYHEDPDAYFAEAYNTTAEPKPTVVACWHCKKPFESKNALHKHLPCQSNAPVDAIPTGNAYAVEVIESDRHLQNTKNEDRELLRTYRSCTARAGLNNIEQYHDTCLDTGCSWSIIDSEFAKKIRDVQFDQTDNPITVKGIKSRDKTNQIAVFSLYFPGIIPSTTPNTDGYAKINVRAYVVEHLQPSILIGTEVLAREGFIFDFEHSKASISSCQNLTFPIACVARPHRIENAMVVSQKQITLPPHSKGRIPVKLRTTLPEGRDFVFEPAKHLPASKSKQNQFAVYAHLVNHDFSFVEAVNDSDEPVVVARHARLGSVSDSEYVTAYRVSAVAEDLARGYGELLRDEMHTGYIKPISNYRRFVEDSFIHANRVATEDTHTSKPKAKPDMPEIIETRTLDDVTVLPSGITVYGKNPSVTRRFAKLTASFDVWGTPDTIGQVNIPEDQWMEIPLKDGWEDRLQKPRVYHVGPKDRAEIDKTFEPLHTQDKMSMAKGHTPSGYPVFVVWKDTGTSKKGRVVVDLRNANKESVPDLYPIPTQEEIIQMVQGCYFISVVDACRFFYQWPVKREHRNRLAVVTHRGQEIFHVAIMGYINSIPYVQRQMDLNLKEFREFCRAYIDDLVVASKTLDQHLTHLELVFQKLEDMNIKLEPTKAYLGFPSVKLLGQRVDALGLTTPEDKIRAIQDLAFPATLRDLEIYLGLTGWFRHYIENYAKYAEPL